jgi:hypothetical protein
MLEIRFFLLLVTALPVYNVLFFSFFTQRCHNFKNLDSKSKFSGKNVRYGRYVLGADTDPDPTKRCGSDTIRICIHNTGISIYRLNQNGPDTPYFDADSLSLTGARHKWFYFRYRTGTWNWIHCLTRACSIGEVPQIEGFVWKVDRRLPSQARAKTFSFKS